jgi:TIR domain
MPKIFLSYARLDNLSPPGLLRADGKPLDGAVTSIFKQLEWEFASRLGQPHPEVWRDKEEIHPGARFNSLIEAGLRESAILLVVLSRNWMQRDKCREELTTFGQQRAAEDIKLLEKRIIVLALNEVEPDLRPRLLQGQEGFKLYQLPSRAKFGGEDLFFNNGVGDHRYYEVMKHLSNTLWTLAQELSPPRGGPVPMPAPEPPPGPPADPQLNADDRQRTVYLARLVEELRQRGYAVVPPPGEQIPNDDKARRYITAALENAEASIHLIGERPGYSPEDEPPIVSLQLSMAGQRTTASGDRRFRRIIWAPRRLAEDGLATGGGAAERDPLAVVDALDTHIDGDKIESRALTDFVGFLIAYLDTTAPRAERAESLGAGASIYLYHEEKDSGYALRLARAVRQRNLRLISPVFDGESAELRAIHRQKLADCDAVVLCWASATEAWVDRQAALLEDWREFGRKHKFAVRGLVAGPPPSGRKHWSSEIKPDGIDLVLDLTDKDVPPPEALDPLIAAAVVDVK